MLRKERAVYIQKRLQELYPETPIPLDHKDPYTLLIAVLLSAQCTDVRVNQITPLLFARADTPQDMVKLSVEEIKEIIRPCGLSPMKSKGIAGLSRILLNEHGGKVPADMKAFISAGTFPPCSLSRMRESPAMPFDFIGESPHGRIISLISSTESFTISCGVSARAKSKGVI